MSAPTPAFIARRDARSRDQAGPAKATPRDIRRMAALREIENRRLEREARQ